MQFLKGNETLKKLITINQVHVNQILVLNNP